ncbi:hypothetical protein H5410_046514 [Solanum commersonii]|uniref:Uncharacterized protein n=1 Tax=Solanum commersonii TaxID=4109 RepID=A0A9J5XGP5_SOLCO|nr:hypothetical protein H5410_046514 [Solanum commersonii]
MCCKGPFDEVSQDHRYIRRSTGLAHWNKRRSPGRSATHQLGSSIFKPSFLCSFQPPCSFLPSSVHALPQTPNTLNLRIFIRY